MLATYPAISYWLKIRHTSARKRGSSRASSGPCSVAPAKFNSTGCGSEPATAAKLLGQ